VRRPLALVIVLIVVLVAVPLALAGGGAGGGGHAYGKSKFQLNGRVVSVDAETGSLVVLVKCGSRTVKPFRGLELTLVVDPEARIKDGPASEEADEAVLLTLADLVEGARVHVGGRIDRTDPANPVYVARKIIVQRWPEVVPTEPTPEPSTEPTDEPTPDPTDSVTP
jgi:hypothetical protein